MYTFNRGLHFIEARLFETFSSQNISFVVARVLSKNMYIRRRCMRTYYVDDFPHLNISYFALAELIYFLFALHTPSRCVY
jgi:hypothetical protein